MFAVMAISEGQLGLTFHVGGDRELRVTHSVQDHFRETEKVGAGFFDGDGMVTDCPIGWGELEDRLVGFLGHGHKAAVMLQRGKARWVGHGSEVPAVVVKHAIVIDASASGSPSDRKL